MVDHEFFPYIRVLQPFTKHFDIVSHFSIIPLQNKLNGTRLLSPETEYISCLKNCWTTQGLRSYTIRKLYENLKIASRHPSLLSRKKKWKTSAIKLSKGSSILVDLEN